MMPDLNAQQERQLWAAYRLILSWPKCEEVQRGMHQSERTGDEDQHTETPERNELGMVKQ